MKIGIHSVVGLCNGLNGTLSLHTKYLCVISLNSNLETMGVGVLNLSFVYDSATSVYVPCVVMSPIVFLVRRSL